VWIGVSKKLSPLLDSAFSSGTRPTGVPLLGAGPVALIIPKSRALICIWLAEGELTNTPSSIVESTDEIPGRVKPPIVGQFLWVTMTI